MRTSLSNLTPVMNSKNITANELWLQNRDDETQSRMA